MLLGRGRDVFEEADELYWASLHGDEDNGLAAAEKRYEAAKKRALALGFQYRTVDQLASEARLEEIVRRIEAIGLNRDGMTRRADVDALLGGVQEPRISLTSAFEKYIENNIGLLARGRSQVQLAAWEKVKRRAVKNFVSLVGDKPIDEVTRADALAFHDWWVARVTGANDGKPMSPNSANKDLGNLRILFREHFKRLGMEDHPNPFRNLRLSEPKSQQRDIPPFDKDWIVDRILAPNALATLNTHAALIVLAMIETGARPSEICNFLPDQIFLDTEVPYISIRPRNDRAIKTDSSARDIPLIGVSLEAMKRAPSGFEQYRDGEAKLSAALMKRFRKMDLFPTPQCRIYSFRHGFEKRMLEAGIDFGLRCTLMGHAVERPNYGDGGSIGFRRDQLMKIVLPFDVEILPKVPLEKWI